MMLDHRSGIASCHQHEAAVVTGTRTLSATLDRRAALRARSGAPPSGCTTRRRLSVSAASGNATPSASLRNTHSARSRRTGSIARSGAAAG